MPDHRSPVTDPFFEARRHAGELLEELGIDRLPVDPLEIAQRLGIELRAFPAGDTGASGMLVRVGEGFGICYPTHLYHEGFKRFSVAHELGHFRIPGHYDSVVDARGGHVSRAGFQSAERHEQEADQFASALLMPAGLFVDALRDAGQGLEAIERVAGLCGTSPEAAAIRYAHLGAGLVAVIKSRGDVMDYARFSPALSRRLGMDMTARGEPLPKANLTRTFNESAANVTKRKFVKGTSNLGDWFAGACAREMHEEVLGLGDYGRTLTLLWDGEPFKAERNCQDS